MVELNKDQSGLFIWRREGHRSDIDEMHKMPVATGLKLNRKEVNDPRILGKGQDIYKTVCEKFDLQLLAEDGLSRKPPAATVHMKRPPCMRV